MLIHRRLLGAALLLAAYVPFHRLLDPAETGLAGATTRRVTESAWTVGIWGTVLVAGAAAALTLLLKADPARALSPLARVLVRAPAVRFALACALAAAGLSAAVSLFVFGGLPTSVDEMVQMAHARALLAGGIALPLPGDPAAWMIQNSLLTPHGWASVYPPLHTAALAVGMAAGLPWLVGPVATGMMAGFTAVALPRVFPDRPAAARGAAVLVAVSPFVVFMGGTFLSHTLAAALAAFTLWAALRARDGSVAWAAVAGAGVGAFVCTRPWTGMVLSLALVATAWLPAARRRGMGWSLPRVAALGAGGLPFAALLLGWNQALFGHPLRLGYTTAFGPSHGLGFHVDPWGNAYGALEAVAYTGADLVQLGMALLESPFPAVALIGLGFALAPRRWDGAGPVVAWAVAGVAANAAYWHHGIHLGPRLLYETAPAWVILWVMAARALGDGGSPLAPRLRRAVVWVAALSLVGAATALPSRVTSLGGGAAASARLPEPPSRPALVFAHGSWPSRVSARLAASGMRRDSVETALRRNDLCSVEGYAAWRAAAGTAPAPTLDLTPRPGPAPGLTSTILSPGNAVLVRAGARPSPGCLREARADRLGSVELEPLLWQAPPVAGEGVVVARDLGPEANEALRRAFAGRDAFVLVAGAEGAPPRLLPYDEGMALLWGAPVAVTGAGG